ncbi:MAG: undecaprenyl-diphosphate phosphatase [Alphaproteobacteria bacterium]
MVSEVIWQTLLLGIIEGLTEFIPVSSTGHLIFFVDLLKFQGPPGKVFEVAIQLGAILAVCCVYFQRLATITLHLHHDPKAQRFVWAILLGFLPAAIIGFLAHDFIKAYLFNPYVVACSLIVGGFIILFIERYLPKPRYQEIGQGGWHLALKIGFFQVLAMIPGVSRSGATIVGARVLGVETQTAMEFSFFLAIPTMLGATSLDLYKARHALISTDMVIISIGFVAAFLSAILVVRTILSLIRRYGLAPFGWYRLAAGTFMLVFLYLL